MSQTFSKWTRPHFPDDAETWSESEAAPTLSGWEERHEVPPVLVIPEPSELAGEWRQLSLTESTSRSEASPARTSPWPASGPVYPAAAAVSGLNSSGSCASCGHSGASLRMFRDSYPATGGKTSVSFSAVWPTSGMGGPTGFWTRDGVEFPSVVVVSSLSDVLETSGVPPRYFLSAKAAAGILRRAENRNKTLPPRLMTALEGLAATYR